MSFKPAFLALLATTLIAPPLFAAPPARKPTAKEKAEKDKAEKDKAEKEKAEQAAREKAEREAAEKAEKDRADKEASDKAEKDKADKEAADKAAKEKAEEEARHDPFEEPGKTYRFIGLRYRDAVIPRFILNLFASGGRTINVPMVGPELTTRKDRLELDFAIMYADYTMGPTLFKGKSEPEEGYEMVASGIRQLFFMLDILYEIPLEKKDGKVGRYSLLVGGGVGLGIVMGPLYRSQTYPRSAGATGDDPSKWGLCQGTGNPNQAYCENPNNHFSPGNDVKNGYAEPSWANGGTKPLIFPWIALPQVSFRYKPIKQLQTKADLGFSTSGFFFGFSASYGL